VQFEITFGNARGEHRNITVALEPDEIAKAKASDDPDLFLMTYALRRGYREVPEGFRHVSAPEGIRLLRAN
jgi:hypothetical protein